MSSRDVEESGDRDLAGRPPGQPDLVNRSRRCVQPGTRHQVYGYTGLLCNEAIVAGKKALRRNSYPEAYLCLASAFAHLGRDAEAREAAARVLETDPAFTISAWIARGGQSNAKLLIEGLRKAGLPE